jgi:PAS domain S-box-containing protein
MRAPRDDAQAFVDALVARTSLEYAAVWLQDDTGTFHRVHATDTAPPGPSQMAATHPLWKRLQDDSRLSLFAEAAADLFPDRALSAGALVAHRLDELGFVEVHDPARPTPFTEAELEPLTPLFDKLRRVLEGGRSHQRLENEVDERQRTDERLQRSQSRLSTLIQNLQDAVLVENADREVVLANRAFCDLFQIPAPPDTLVGADCAAAAEAAKSLFADPAVLTERVRAILDASVSVTAETLQMADGRIIERDYVPIRLDGESLGHLWTYRDVTAQRRADARLQESELRFRTMFEKHRAPMLLIKPDSGAIVDANASAIRFYGYDADTFLSMTIQEINQLSEAEVAMRRAAATSEEQNRFVFPHRLQSGEVRTVEVYSTPIAVEGTKLLFSIIHDITERTEAEEKLRQSEERWRRLVESHREPIQISVDGVVQYINPAGADVFGAHAPEDVIGKRVTDFVRSDAVRDALQTRQAQLQRGHPTDPFELEIERLDGERRLISVYSVPIEYEGQTAAQTVVHDITAQRAAETELRRLKDFYEQILNVMPIDLAIFDADGRYQYVTPSAVSDPHRRAQIIGLNDVEYAKQRGLEVDKARHRLDTIRRVARTRQTERFEETVDAPDGAHRHYIRFVSPVVTDGDVTQVLGYGIDITHRKRAETNLLKAKEQAEASLAAKERFLATMSHEIRTPLNAVLGMAHLLNESDLTDTQRSYLDSIRFSGKTLLTLLNTVLDFARVDAGDIELEPRPLAPADLVHQVCNMFRSTAAENGVALSVAVAPGVPEQVVGDAARVSQLLTNLVSNALKFTDEGHVRVDIAPTVPPEEDGSRGRDDRATWLMMRVSDTGIGIPPDEQQRIFDEFTRANSPDVQVRNGVGLGLAIVRRLVDAMGGTITVDSTVGTGSTFTLYLPFEAADAAPASTTTASAASSPHDSAERSLAGTRVLAADDNAMNQVVVRDLLRGWGADIDIVDDGAEVLQRLDASAYDLVLMDVQMPIMDGLEATRRLREQGHTVPIIALTASMPKHDQHHAFDAGMDAFVSKPFDPEVLYRTVVQYVSPDPDAGAPSYSAVSVVPASEERPTEDDTPKDNDTPTENGAESGAAATVDLAFLRENLESAAAVRNIAQTFITQVDRFVASVQAARADQDAEAVGKHIHWMKSSASLVQAEPLSAQLQTLHDGGPPYDEAALDAVLEAAHAAQSAMVAILSEEDS